MKKELPYKTTLAHSCLLLMGILFVVSMLAACGSQGVTTAHTQTPPPRILGAGTLINDGRYVVEAKEGTFAMHMVNAQVGWGLHSNGNGTHATLYRTTDGGKSWKHLLAPSDLPSAQFDFYGFDETMAFLIPMDSSSYPHPLSYYYGTTDGGATWQRRNWPVMPALKGVAATFKWTFLDHNQGWVTAAPIMTGSCDCGDVEKPMKPVDFEVLFHTTDGGQHWQKVARLPSKYDIDSLIFTDANNGWLSAKIDDPKHPFPDPYHYPSTLFLTHDGGHTWTQQSLALPPQEVNQPLNIQITFSTAQEGSLFVDFLQEGQYADAIKTYQYLQQADGTTWKVNGSFLPAASDGTYVRFTRLDDTHIAENGYGYSSLLTLQKNSWVGTPLPGTYHDFVLQMFSLQTGIALAAVSNKDSAIFTISNGGKTWTRVGDVPQA